MGNGDVDSPEAAKKMLKETKCDYVMVGRASKGNPFIFKQINDYLEEGKYKELSLKEKLNYFRRYLKYTKDFRVKFSDIKVHAMQYTRGVEGGARLRNKIAKIKDVDELLQFFDELSRNATP